MNRLIHKLLQYIRFNQKRQMQYRQQLVRKHQCKSHVREQQDKSSSSAIPSCCNKHKPKTKEVYHQGNSKYDILRENWYNMLVAMKPTHFLTIQFPKNMRSSSLKVSKDNLRRLMARFEQCLIGSRWTKSYLPFYAFAEIGPKDGYTHHFHILFNAGIYTTNALQNALDDTCLELSLCSETFYLEEIETYEIIHYCLKDAKVTNYSDDCDTIILSSNLFNL